jgi:hypothetical protein
MSVIYREMQAVDFEDGVYLAGTAVTATATELNKLAGNGVTAADLTRLHASTATAAELNRVAGITGTPVVAKRINFSETAGAGTYTGSITLPANAVLIDIIIHATALWTATTSATMKVGDAGNDAGFYTAIDLKATDLLAGESLSFAQAGGKEGAYIANSQVSKRRDPSDRTLAAIVTTVGAAGNAGSTSVTFVYSLPVSTDITSATKA